MELSSMPPEEYQALAHRLSAVRLQDAAYDDLVLAEELLARKMAVANTGQTVYSISVAQLSEDGDPSNDWMIPILKRHAKAARTFAEKYERRLAAVRTEIARRNAELPQPVNG